MRACVRSALSMGVAQVCVSISVIAHQRRCKQPPGFGWMAMALEVVAIVLVLLLHTAHANEPESHATHMTSQLSRWGKDNGAQAWLVSSLLSWCWLSAALCGYVRGHRQGHIEGCLSFSACSHHGSEVPFGTHLLRCLCCGFGRCALDHLRAFGGGLVGWWLACQWVVMNVDRACRETKALAPSHHP